MWVSIGTQLYMYLPVFTPAIHFLAASVAMYMARRLIPSTFRPQTNIYILLYIMSTPACVLEPVFTLPLYNFQHRILHSTTL